jgi:hypothetical protein
VTARDVLDGMKARRPVPNAHDTTHVVKVVCTICVHLSYRKVKLGEEVAHDCTSFPVSMTICAWEYEAPTDVARLTGAVEAVLTLTADWHERGEHDMELSKSMQKRDNAMMVYLDGVSMVENARLIRAAIENALGESP